LADEEGMGMVTMRRVLDRLGGRIWFETAEGAGTMYYLTLSAEPSVVPHTDV
jgi:signal transduction histidine kinase